MPTYRVEDPTTGKTIRLTGDSPPTEAELNEIFAAVGGPKKTTGQKVAAAVAPYARPVLEGGGLLFGGAGGAALGGAAGGVGAIPGALIGAGTGYAAGRRLATGLEEYAGMRQPQSIGRNFLSTGRDVVEGAAMEAGGQVAGAGLKPVTNWLTRKAPALYESAMKIPPSIPNEIRTKAVKTGIEGGYAPTEKGLGKLQENIKALNKQIADEIDGMVQTRTVRTKTPGKVTTRTIPGQTVVSSPSRYAPPPEGALWNMRGADPQLDQFRRLFPETTGRAAQTVTETAPGRTVVKKVGTIDMNDVVKRVNDLKGFYSKLPPEAAADYIGPLEELQKKFASGGKITPKDAQAMKQTLYALNRKHYGELKSAIVEGNKAIARGLKEEIVKQNPSLAGLNAKDSALINLETVLERAVNRTRNYDVIRLGDTVMAAAGGAAGGAGGAEAAFIFKRIFESPAVKAQLAFALRKAGKMSFPTTSRAVSWAAMRRDDDQK